jgi:hypothetical protein
MTSPSRHLLLTLMLGLLSSLTSIFAADAPSTTVSIQLPAETAVYRQGPGQELAQSLCITCHSADYAEMQPPMPKKFWEANVKKMREKFGAPIPENLSAQLAAYLTTAYGIPDKK